MNLSKPARWIPRCFQALTGLFLALQPNRAAANPVGLRVTQGTAVPSMDGAKLTLQVSANAVLDWQSFNIKAGESTSFLQPSSRSVVWNRINDSSPSRLFGQLNANGCVVLFNQNGFFFGPDSVINVGGFLATTAAPSAQNFSGGQWQFSGAPPAASIVNYGQIKAGAGNSIFLIAEKIENHGILTAPDGTIGLYAGKDVLVSERPDGRGLSATVRLPEGSVDNAGKLIADGGAIALRAQVVNQNGLIQANSVRQHNGVIELVAAEQINLGENSRVTARGDENAVSDGGKILVKSDGNFSDASASRLDVSGGIAGGNGGSVEVSAPLLDSVRSQIIGLASAGWSGGSLSLDPVNIIIGNSGSGSIGSGTVAAGSAPGTLLLNVNSAFIGFSQITLEATRDISLANFTTWNLNDSTGISDAGSLLTLRAGRNIVFGNSSHIAAGAGWSVKMFAGDLTSGRTVVGGEGGIYFNGGPDTGFGKPNFNGSLETGNGSIELLAENEIILAGGYIRTDSGGNLNVSTLKGSIDAGTKRDGFIFSRRGYDISPAGLGGIATTAGGDITLHAGKDVLSFLPTSGAYGGGNVTVSADHNVLGKFLVRNGVGQISAGTDVGSGASPASLNLIRGRWDVTAGHDIYLNEVLNPNGSLNPNRLLTGPKIPFQFDYALDAAVNLTAANSVQLLGNAPAHVNDNPDRLPIYPPQLNISAGPGGVVLGNDVVLFPSPLAVLNINTTGGGDLRSSTDNSFRLIVSDSGNPGYTSFVDGHAATPLHLASAADPIRVNVSGNIENIRFQFPKKSLINVAGDALNFFFTGQNLTDTDETRLTVGGNFRNRSDITSEPVTGLPDFSIFDPLVATRTDLNLASKLSYSLQTHQLTFRGRMTDEEHNFLLHPVVRSTDPLTGRVELDQLGNPIVVAAHFSDATVINQLFQDSQDVPAFPTKNGGLLIGGPGLFSLSARKIDLGITAGIRSLVTALNPALARNADGSARRGADIKVTASEDLEMTSSQIASFNGGSIDVQAAGNINVGAQEQFTSDDTPKGIYSGSGGNVSVTAGGNIIVNGSRIASYDGGNVTVVSTGGNVDAGEGAKGFFSITSQQLNPVTGAIEVRNDRFFGSGIVALTRPDSASQVGDISVTAGQDILANAGGILQLAFNHSDRTSSSVTLDAGRNIEANQSGILGANVNLKAQGNIQGLVVANQNLNIDAARSVSVTALASGGVTIKSGESVSGTVIGGGNVSVSGSDISASVISTGGSAAANDSASRANAFQNVAAPAAQQTAPLASKTVAENKPELTEEDEKKKARKPVLARSTGRVTVILPNRK